MSRIYNPRGSAVRNLMVLDAPDQEEESPDMILAKEIAASESRFISKVVL